MTNVCSAEGNIKISVDCAHSNLVAKLDEETPGWQESSVILLDNAPYHVSADARSYLRKMQVPIMYTAPYSYSASPIESLFSILKLGELNEEREPTGKR